MIVIVITIIIITVIIIFRAPLSGGPSADVPLVLRMCFSEDRFYTPPPAKGGGV